MIYSVTINVEYFIGVTNNGFGSNISPHEVQNIQTVCAISPIGKAKTLKLYAPSAPNAELGYPY